MDYEECVYNNGGDTTVVAFKIHNWDPDFRAYCFDYMRGYFDKLPLNFDDPMGHVDKDPKTGTRFMVFFNLNVVTPSKLQIIEFERDHMYELPSNTIKYVFECWQNFIREKKEDKHIMTLK